MICFRDRTFCPFYEDCAVAASCDRVLTQKDIDEASEAGLSIGYYAEKPGCFRKKRANFGPAKSEEYDECQRST